MIGVVADDITGANDIWIMFAKSGYLTHVYTFEDAMCFEAAAMPDVAILDTNSRFDSPEIAYQKVFKATKLLQKEGFNQFFNKTCSVFRGNIGAEFDAMLDALNEEFAIIVLGFPKNGRTTINGIHYVHGKKLEESEFKYDPMHPMHASNIMTILQSQTKRKVELIRYDVIAQGHEVLEKEIMECKHECNYLIMDVKDQASLKIIAQAVHDEKVLCGSSALAEELPAFWSNKHKGDSSIKPEASANVGILCVAGSLMPQTAAQIKYLSRLGTFTLELDSQKLFDAGNRKKQIDDAVDHIVERLKNGENALLYSANSAKTVEDTIVEGLKRGMSKSDVSRLVSETIAEIVAASIRLSGLNRIVIAGGDTSASVCARLEVKAVKVWREIQPGLPSCISLVKPHLFLVLKSGSFGKENFFEEAINHLKEN
jgi:uncharacterized protein YgbK (DUF1537 family)